MSWKSAFLALCTAAVFCPWFGQAAEIRQMTVLDESPAPQDRLAVGINYTGAQLRWGLSSRWAVEGRFQTGKASSDYGDVTSKVVGLRAYRFFHRDSKWPLYLGSEGAYAQAEPERSVYKTRGLAAGLFGGFQYRFVRRLSLAVDIGPYVISLTETHTQTSATTLDFVLNTALLVRIF